MPASPAGSGPLVQMAQIVACPPMEQLRISNVVGMEHVLHWISLHVSSLAKPILYRLCGLHHLSQRRDSAEWMKMIA
jgi:hypothetical protein